MLSLVCVYGINPPPICGEIQSSRKGIADNFFFQQNEKEGKNVPHRN